MLTQAKASAAKVAAWLSDWDGAEIPMQDIGILLAAFERLTKPKASRK